MRTWLLFCFLLLSLPSFAQLAAVGDLNGDGKPDVVVTDGGTEGQIGVFLNTGNGSLGTGTFINVGSAATSVWLADFNGDGHLDILAVTSPKLQILFGDGKGGFAAPVAIPQSGIPAVGPSVVADFNGDGIADIAFAFNSPNPTLAILFGDGHGGFSLSPPHLIAVESGTNTTPSALFVVDANHDGLPDLVINSSGAINSGQAKSFLAINDGNGGFVTSQLSPDTAVQAVGDFNSDGNIDFFIPSSSGSQTVLFGDGQGGVLYSPSHRTCFNQPNSAQFGVDFDHNGTTDLVGFFGVNPGNGHGGFGDSFSLSRSDQSSSRSRLQCRWPP